MTDPTSPDAPGSPQLTAHIPVAVLIGAVTIAWNEAQETVFRLFHQLSGMPKPMAEAVFFSLRSDAGQRDIARAVCRECVGMAEEWRSEVISLITDLDRKSGERNAAIHTMWDSEGLYKGKIQPSQFIDPSYHNRTLKPDIVEQFKALLPEIMLINLKLQLYLRKWETSQSSPETHDEQSPRPEASSSGDAQPAPSQGNEPPPQASLE